jgi:hypothetical protein
VSRSLRWMGLLVAVVALAATPAISMAGPGKGKGKGKSGSHCTIKRGFTVRGTLVSFTPDNPGTSANEEDISITVTGANRHARRAGWEKGDAFSPGSGDAFKYKLVEFEPGEQPTGGEKVKIVGKIEYTKKKCASGQSLAARYGDVNVRKIAIKDAD